jgi:hypothetical protein
MKVVTPPLQQACLIFPAEPLDAADLLPTETTAPLKPHRIEPEFGCLIVAFDMDVGRLLAITRIEEETVGANA